MEFTSDKISITGETYKSEMQWEKIYKVKEAGGWILLYITPYQAYFIPTKDFGDKLDEFRQIVRSQPIKQKLRG